MDPHQAGGARSTHRHCPPAALDTSTHTCHRPGQPLGEDHVSVLTCTGGVHGRPLGEGPLRHSSDPGQDPQVGWGTLPTVTGPRSRPAQEGLALPGLGVASTLGTGSQQRVPALSPTWFALGHPLPHVPSDLPGGTTPCYSPWGCWVQSRPPCCGPHNAGACCGRTGHVGLSGPGWQQTGEWRRPGPPGTA